MSRVGLIAMSSIILIIAASFSFQNGASSTATAVAGGAAGWASCAKTSGGNANATRRRAPKIAVPRPGLGSLRESAATTPRNGDCGILVSLGGWRLCHVWGPVLSPGAPQNSGGATRIYENA